MSPSTKLSVQLPRVFRLRYCGMGECLLLPGNEIRHAYNVLYIIKSHTSPHQCPLHYFLFVLTMAGKDRLDFVHQNAILVETIRKSQKYQKLHTEFSINPHRKRE